MKKLFLIALIGLSVTGSYSQVVTDRKTMQDTSNVEIRQIDMIGVTARKTMQDTAFVLPHPTADDSVKVVRVVNGVLSVVSVFTKDTPLINWLLGDSAVGGGIVALILGIWRRIELRRLKRKYNIKS